MQKLFIINALSPFFVKNSESTVNWSKVIFANLEKGGSLAPATKQRIIRQWGTYIQQVAGLGYNAISVDDLSHLVAYNFYGPELKQRISQYQQL